MATMRTAFLADLQNRVTKVVALQALLTEANDRTDVLQRDKSTLADQLAAATAAAAGSFTTVAASSTVTATGAVTGSTANDSIGNVRNIVQQTKSAPYTLVATDNGQCIITNSGVTVPASVFVAGNVVTVYNNSGSTITITQGGGLTLQFAGQSTSTTGNRSLALYGITTILFLSASSAVITGVGMT